MQRKLQAKIKSKIGSRILDNSINPISFFSEHSSNENTLYQEMGPKKENTAWAYGKIDKEIFEESSETFVPKWDISLSDLQPIFEESYLAKVFDWKHVHTETWTCENDAQDFKKTITRTYSRRIPWLYVDNGKVELYMMSICNKKNVVINNSQCL